MKKKSITGGSRVKIPRALRRVWSDIDNLESRFLYRRAVKLFSHSINNSVDKSISRPEKPVIVIGMHRSGTSLMARLLEELGVAMGRWKDKEHAEAAFFRHRNELLFTLTNATWDNPTPLSHALERQDWRKALSRAAAIDLGSIRSLWFAPPEGLFRFGRKQDRLWGFKDPRSSITLPVWLDIFPDAKVIHIVRNGNAVADSLLRRGKKMLETGTLSLPSLDRPMGLDLWAEYVLTVHKHCSSLPTDMFCEVKYEELVATPLEILRLLAEFLGTDTTGERLEQIASMVRRPRNSEQDADQVSSKVKRALKLYEYL